MPVRSTLDLTGWITGGGSGSFSSEPAITHQNNSRPAKLNTVHSDQKQSKISNPKSAVPTFFLTCLENISRYAKRTGPELTWVDPLRFLLCGFSPNMVEKKQVSGSKVQDGNKFQDQDPINFF